MKRFALLILGLSFSLSAYATMECPQIRGNTIIFGGLGSKTSDMEHCYPNFLAVSHGDGGRFVIVSQKRLTPDNER